MKDYFDTSGMIRAFRKRQTPEGVTRTHSLAEFYCILTGTGIKEQRPAGLVSVTASPQEAAEHARRAFSKMEFVDFGPNSALDSLQEAARRNVSGRLIHDWFHVAVAEASKCARIVTLNQKDFRQLSDLPLVAEL